MSTAFLREKCDAIVSAMRNRRRILVAYSGGVDSGLVLKLAHEALGSDCLGVVADSPSLPRRELAAAKASAKEIGAPIEVVQLSELENENYVENSGLRCYFCRVELSKALKDIAAARNFTTIADGANLSDLGDYRPGMKALTESGFWHPLLEFGLDKEAVRAMAKHLGLSWFDKPSSPCLSSRIIVGEPITAQKLAMIEAGEDFLHDLGFRQVRVRCLAGLARIEVTREEIPRLSARPTIGKVTKRLKKLGFTSVEVDLQGYRPGSMNQRA